MIKFIMNHLPSEETYEGGIRRQRNIMPEVAIRDVIANALIHQDFTLSGTGPIIDIFSYRVEVTNAGSSTVEVNRIIDERGSRNEKFAATMRMLGICEERSGGIDKALIEIERRNLPPLQFASSNNSMRVVLFNRRPFSELSKADRNRACFQHCVIMWLSHDYMSNTSSRQRFSLEQEGYQAASLIISETKNKKLIKPADADQGNRSAKYIPIWA